MLTARLLATLALLVGGLVLGSAAPAAACSCTSDDPVVLAGRAEVAFVGVLTSRRSDGHDVAHLFAVEGVHAGDVRRFQDVVTPDLDEAGCGVDWATGTRMLVLGRVDDEGRVASDLCSGSVPAAGSRYAATVQALSETRPPLPGRSVIAFSAGPDLWWSAAVVGLLGALGMVVVRRLASRSGRG